MRGSRGFESHRFRSDLAPVVEKVDAGDLKSLSP